MSQALTTVTAMGKAVQAIETLEEASPLHNRLAGFARALGKSREDPDKLIGTTEWRIRLEHWMGATLQKVERSQGKRTDLTLPDDQSRLQAARETGQLTRDAAQRYEVMSYCPTNDMEAYFTNCRAKRKENVVRLRRCWGWIMRQLIAI